MAATLPLEILDHILSLSQGSVPTWEEDARNGRQARGNPNTALLYASLVSKTWATAAQRALYRHAIFPTRPGQGTHFYWLFSAARKRHRTVSLWIRPEKKREFLEVLDSCEGLENLTFGEGFSGGMSAPKPWWDILCKPSFKDLKTLSLPSAEFIWQRPCTISFSLSSLSLWLNADDRNFGLPLVPSALFNSSSSTLSHLHLRITGFHSRRPFPANLFPAPLLPLLRHLIVEEEHASEVAFAFPGVGNNPDEPVVTSLRHFFVSFPSLETLELRARSPGATRAKGFFSSTIESLPFPATLLRLIVDISDLQNVDEVLASLNEDVLTLLMVLEFPGLRIGDVVGRDERLDRVRDWCRLQSIKLVWADGEDDLEERQEVAPDNNQRWDSEGEESSCGSESLSAVGSAA